MKMFDHVATEGWLARVGSLRAQPARNENSIDTKTFVR